MDIKKNKKDFEINLQEEWLSTEETATFLKVSKKTLKRYRDLGKLPYSKDGRKIRFKKSDILNYLNKFYFSKEQENKESANIIMKGKYNG